ncbi:FMN-binding protein [Streptomyces cadmiisoli]|uniref:FMN-binding protein n=1 Tax=Streptomyces cadmiisoli TaxID=2184053 RepID=UPI003D70A8DA
MKRALPVLVLTVAGIVPVWRYAPADGTATAGPGRPAPPPAATASGTPSAGASGAASLVVAGPTVATEKGDVQVEVTFEGEAISAVRMLKQPNHPQTTAAVPTLIEETLRAQSADIDTVSGATITSEAYQDSLQAAIDARGA